MITFRALILIHNMTSFILNSSSIYKMFYSFFFLKRRKIEARKILIISSSTISTSLHSIDQQRTFSIKVVYNLQKQNDYIMQNIVLRYEECVYLCVCVCIYIYRFFISFTIKQPLFKYFFLVSLEIITLLYYL